MLSKLEVSGARFAHLINNKEETEQKKKSQREN